MAKSRVVQVKVYVNCDMATIVWETDGRIDDCRGFALERTLVRGKKSSVDWVNTWVGFKDQAHKPHESRPSTDWPIQRYIWSDYYVNNGDSVRYRVVPILRRGKELVQDTSSAQTPPISVTTGNTKGFHAYFNRGIVQAQWLAYQKLPNPKSTLTADINNPKSKNRLFLAGDLRGALLDLLDQAKKNGSIVFAALYELNDPELLDRLFALGKDCSLILASGAYKSADKKKGTPAVPDENKGVRDRLDSPEGNGIHVYDRLVKSPHFGHNKFVVVCDPTGKKAECVWTGSTNWTVTGLCTQVNNGLLIDSPDLAAGYLARWYELKAARSDYPASLSTSKTTRTGAKLGAASMTAWNAPVVGLKDLNDANAYINKAKEGVLFLMFNPGRANTLLNTILALDTNKLLVHGVVNQDPGGKANPVLQLVHRGDKLPQADLTAVIPQSVIAAGRSYFASEFQFSFVMIHSKVVVIDPFGKNPVVMTGSHNLGPKASGKNDDNLVIIRDAPGLAMEYAVNIMDVYSHFKWQYNDALQNKRISTGGKNPPAQYDGNFDNDAWQDGYLKDGKKKRELQFWL